jgi:hypothetical protein
MKSKVIGFFFRDTTNWVFWVFIAFIFKLFLFIFQISVHPPQNEIAGFFGLTWGDTWSYLDPIDKLVKKGSYWPDYRMPGYGLAYLPLIVIFSKATACNLLIIIQLLLASLSVYVLALTAKKIFHTKISFYATFYLFSISCLSNLYDASLQTESLTVSLLIFSTYFFIRYFDNFSKRTLFLSGFFLTWVIFIRPVFAPLLAFYCIILIVHSINFKKTFITSILIFLISFILLDGLWIVRNYRCYKSIIPLTRYVGIYPAALFSQIRPVTVFVSAWGGDYNWWDPDADIRWFGRKADPPGRVPLTDKEIFPPPYIYTSKFNEDSLKRLRVVFMQLEAVNYNGYDDSLSAYGQKYRFFRDKLNSYTVSIKNENPFVYYVRGPWNAFKRFLFYSGTNELFYYIPDDKFTAGEYLFQMFYCGFYILTLSFGFIGILLMCKSLVQLKLQSIFMAIPVYTVLIHPIILRLVERRYFLPAWPFLIICGLYGAFWVYNNTFGIKHPIIFSGNENHS